MRMDEHYADALRQALELAKIHQRPVGVLDLEAVEKNLDALRQRADGKPVRVASKSLRVRNLLEHTLNTPGFRGVMSYSLDEALWLAEHGIRDILVAYPSADVEAIGRLRASDEAASTITLMVDSPRHLDLIDSTAGAPVRVAVELDGGYRPHSRLSFGALRSPLFSADDVARLAREVVARDGFTLVGLMAYEGQVAGVPDAGRGPYRRAVRIIKRRSIAEIAARRAQTVARIREIADLEFINGGGTGSLESTASEDCVSEVAAGSGIIGPALFDDYTSFRPYPALHLGFSVVRRPGPFVATLHSGGWIASGAAGKDRLPSIAYPAGLRYSRDEGAGEVQTPVLGVAADDLTPGDTVWLRHAKAGEPAERLNHYVVVAPGADGLQVQGIWRTYRGEGKAFG